MNVCSPGKMETVALGESGEGELTSKASSVWSGLTPAAGCGTMLYGPEAPLSSWPQEQPQSLREGNWILNPHGHTHLCHSPSPRETRRVPGVPGAAPSFASKPGVSHLLPESMDLWQAYLLVCKAKPQTLHSSF